MAFKITLSNYSYLAGSPRNASFWTANGYQMASLAVPWNSSENGAGYYVQIDLMKAGSAIPVWEWTGYLPADNRQYTFDVGNTNMIDSGPLSGGSAPVISSFDAQTNIFNNGTGGADILYWQVTGATTISINQGIGTVAAAGQRDINVTGNIVYTLTATNSYGSTSAQVSIQVNAAPPPPTGAPIILSVTATPSAVQKGKTTLLYWNIDPNGLSTSVTISNIGTVGLTGTQVVGPWSATGEVSFTVTATNSAGSTIQTIHISVIDVVNYFTANPIAITAGQSATLSWNVAGQGAIVVQSVYIDGVGAVAQTGTQQVSPAASTIYYLRVETNYGEVVVSATVTVTQVTLPAIISFSAAPGSLSAAGQVVLAWNITGATNVSINQGVGAVNATSGQVTVQVNQTTVFTITAINSGGSSTSQVSVTVGTVQPPPVIVAFTATPSSLSAAGPVVLAWQVTGAFSVNISGVGTVDSSGQVTVPVAQTTTYTLTATNLFGSSTAHVTVTVAGVIPPPLLIAAGAVGVVAIVLLARKK